jgi:hypothetical protein
MYKLLLIESINYDVNNHFNESLIKIKMAIDNMKCR